MNRNFYISCAINGTLAGALLIAFVRGGVEAHYGSPSRSNVNARVSRQATALSDPAKKVDIARAQTLYTVTAYCPCSLCCGRWADGITASGHVIQPGDKFVAAPARFPFGTMLDIPGYGVVPVLDRGGAIRGNRLDVYFDSHEAALRWGTQKLIVTIKGVA